MLDTYPSSAHRHRLYQQATKAYEVMARAYQHRAQNRALQANREVGLLGADHILHVVSQYAPYALVEVDLKGKALFVNHRWTKMTGLDLVRSRDAKWLAVIHPEDRQRVLAVWFSAAQVSTTSFRLHRANADPIFVVSQCILRTDAVGQPIGFVITLAEAPQVEAQAESVPTDFNSEFMALLSHEIRNPLMVIKANTELLDLKANVADEHLSEEIHKATERIHQEVGRLKQFMDDVITFSAVEQPVQNFHPQSVDLIPFLGELGERMASADPEGRTLGITFSGEPAMVFLDPIVMNHALTNLLSNAFKYSAGAPAPVVEILFEEDAVQILVKDFGIGIPEEEVAQLFQSFYRASNARTIEGSGLGLVITQTCINLHQGTIAVESALGEGTTFTLTLPRQKPALSATG